MATPDRETPLRNSLSGLCKLILAAAVIGSAGCSSESVSIELEEPPLFNPCMTLDAGDNDSCEDDDQRFAWVLARRPASRMESSIAWRMRR